MNEIEYYNKINWNNLVTLYDDAAQNDKLVYKSTEPILSYKSIDYDWPNFNLLEYNGDEFDSVIDETNQLIIRKIIPPYILSSYQYANNEQLTSAMEKNGIRQIDQWINICYDVEKELPKMAEIPNYSLYEVHNDSELKKWTDVVINLFFHGRAIPSHLFMRDMYTILIAQENRTPIGAIMIYWGPEKSAGIYMGGIIPEYRSKGYGREIVTVALDYIKKNNYKYCLGQATRQGIRQWNKLGFLTTGYLDIFWKVGHKLEDVKC